MVARELLSSDTLNIDRKHLAAIVMESCARQVMSQKAPETGYPRGHYVGRNVIRGKVNLYGSKIEGELTINGKRVERLSE